MREKVGLERFRGLLSHSPDKGSPICQLSPHDGGWILIYGDSILMGARGETRIFKTMDAAFRYVRDNVVSHIKRSVRLTVFIEEQLF